jgi:S-adenosylmethionine/arginine decarboxylase-like enzyme
MAHDKQGVSVTYLSSELHISYETWTIQIKNRNSLSQHDSDCSLVGIEESIDIVKSEDKIDMECGRTAITVQR